jgi:hypothetical protein
MSDIVPYVPDDKTQPRIIVQPSPDPQWREREAIREHVRRLAWLLDSAFVIPGTQFRVGVDPLLGLIPILGDLVSFLISSYLILLASKLGLPRAVIYRMLLNTGIDAVLGAIPIVGDVLDAAWRANAKNAALLEKALADPKAASRSSLWYLIGLSLLLIALLTGAILLTVWSFKLLVRALS